MLLCLQEKWVYYLCSSIVVVLLDQEMIGIVFWSVLAHFKGR